MNYKISILVAAYNAEKYIGKCLDSLINQTLREIQIICIDDASTDGTLSILRQYKEMDSRIYILEQKIIKDKPKQGIEVYQLLLESLLPW